MQKITLNICFYFIAIESNCKIEFRVSTKLYINLINRLTVGSGFGSNFWNRPDPTVPNFGTDPTRRGQSTYKYIVANIYCFLAIYRVQKIILNICFYLLLLRNK